jgi:hypothetical protein
MSSAFLEYPKITYNSQLGTNLLVKVSLLKKYLTSYDRFYDYVVKDGERPDMIAYQVYEDSSLDWIIYLVNNIVDPYSGWVLERKNFLAYLQDKYNTLPEKLTSVIIPSSIAYYYYEGLTSDTPEYIASFDYNMSPETYERLGYPSGWVPKSIYDYENEINESKRNIKLLRPVFLNEFTQQFKDVING